MDLDLDLDLLLRLRDLDFDLEVFFPLRLRDLCVKQCAHCEMYIYIQRNILTKMSAIANQSLNLTRTRVLLYLDLDLESFLLDLERDRDLRDLDLDLRDRDLLGFYKMSNKTNQCLVFIRWSSSAIAQSYLVTLASAGCAMYRVVFLLVRPKQ